MVTDDDAHEVWMGEWRVGETVRVRGASTGKVKDEGVAMGAGRGDRRKMTRKRDGKDENASIAV